MKIIRLEDNNNNIFNKICEWNYNWWGVRNNNSIEEVKCYLKHSLCKDNRLPQTFIALINDEPVGMYQISMSDDLVESRPDIYPWIVNVYVDEKKELTTNDILETIRHTHSLSEIMKEPLKKMSEEYENRKLKNASEER